MSNRISFAVATAVALTAVAGMAHSDGHADKALSAAIKARQAQMQLISYNTSLLGDMAKGETEYNADTAASAASNLAAVAKLDRSILWVEGSVQGSVPDTRAKAAIWSDPAGFDTAATNLEMAAAALAEVAGNDLETLRGAMADVGKACGACHDDYRGPRN